MKDMANKKGEKFTVKEASKILGVTTDRVIKLIASKRLPATKNGKSWEISGDSLKLVQDRELGRKEKTAKIFHRSYPKASQKWGKTYLEARSGKSGTGKNLMKVDLEEGRGSNFKGLEMINAQKKNFNYC